MVVKTCERYVKLLPVIVQVVDALTAAQRQTKPGLSEMFTDVYDQMPWHLKEQEAEVMSFIKRNPGILPSDIPLQ